ncbi:NADH-quinone oxidoreductase subunit NuoK [Gammaproteobacteria bacterium]|nr:NADH-quinone oxidoreductase subunit NuoK [Gammaproteobacteria bacterium]
MVSLSEFLILASLLFGIGIAGIIINKKNIITLLMSVEIMLLAINTNFIAFSHFQNNQTGQVFVFFILTVAAAEAAIGLAILVVLFRRLHTIEVEKLDTLKG